MSLPRVRRARFAGAATAILVASGVSFGTWQAVAADGGAPPPDTNPPPSRVKSDGSIIPEPDPAGAPAITSRDQLVGIEKKLDPARSPAVFVCANKGATELKVIRGHEPPPGAQVNPLAGPLSPDADAPCAGYDWVVGR